MFLKTVTESELKKVKNKNQNTHISLFTGAGGLDLGFSRAGWKTRVMIEIDKYACSTLRANWTLDGLTKSWQSHIDYFRKDGDIKQAEKLKKQGVHIPDWYHKPEPVIMERDIKTVTAEEVLTVAKLKVGECGIVSGGFPCQGFSHAGPRMIDDPRNSLYKECVRMVKGILPRTFLFENVPGIISMDKGRIINQICTDLAECGYHLAWYKLNAADYGVPQNRIRVFFIGFRNDVMVFPEKGNIQYHMAGSPGPVQHPDFYLEKYKIQNKYAESYQEKLL